MTPTPQLRFVERDTGTFEQYDVKVTERHGTEVCYRPKTIRVLQQFWLPSDEPYEEWLKVKDGEWRDVPLEKEHG